MAKILATAGSNSSTSINFALIRHTAALLEPHEVDLLELAPLDIPMYSEDHEKEKGFPQVIDALYDRIRSSEGLVLSVNEHNGSPSAFTKNILDWLSRKNRNFLEGTPVLLMSASPGKRGAASSFQVVENMVPRFGGTIVAGFSLPSFRENFTEGEGLVNEELRSRHREALQQFLKALS